MSDELRLDPARALTGARALSAAGTELAELRAGPGAEIAAATAGRPWGSDAMGQSFERNYRPIEEQVLQAWAQLADYLQGLGEAAAASVRDNLQADHEASERISSVRNDLP
jgi:hypothetical protein